MVPESDVIEKIGESGVIVILRKKCSVFIEEHVPALIEAGLKAIEVSLTSDAYAECFTKLVKRHGQQLAIGTGTVLSREQAQRALDDGARFLISPHFDPDLAAFVRGRAIPYIAGCLTPSEIVAAVHAGVDAIKIFPASLGGPEYIASLRAPFPQIRFVPTGGVGPQNAAAFRQAGAWALGIGSEIGEFMSESDTPAKLKQLFSC